MPLRVTPENIAQNVTQSVEHFLSESPTGAKWEALREELLTWIRSIPPGEAFAGLTFAIETHDRYQVQWIAGDLFLQAGIPCNLSVVEWLERVVTRFNLSANTVIRYGKSVFGRQELTDAVKAALAEDRSAGPRKNRLETMLYWLHDR